ncbi:MAG: hypothetical protein IKP00_14200 [Victivallales bacterium]|nr:hypothetical protein [Victivallales bacterium]
MKKLLITFICVSFLLNAADFRTSDAIYTLNEKTGGIVSIASLPSGEPLVTSTENHYLLMTPGGDVTAYESSDSVIKTANQNGSLVFACTNPKLPNIIVTKRYFPYNGGLRRTITYHNNGQSIAFLLTFTELHFPETFRQNLWHLGAGYIGPYKPFPKVDKPRPVNEYRQSSKGMVFVHPDGKAPNLCHYRVKINDTVVLPWFHSTIGHYREYADRLWYLPDGYRMGLGTLDLKPGEDISVTDFLRPFPGDPYTFFEEIFAKDGEVMNEINSILKGPAWLNDVFMNGSYDVLDYIRWLSEMIDDGIFLGLTTTFSVWTDYRIQGRSFLPMAQGGAITPQEVLDYFALQRSITPRAYPSTYHIVISATQDAPVVAEHPSWFRPLDRAGKTDSLFPGLRGNYQTMFNYPECRQFLIDTLFEYTHITGQRSIYLDEAQMTNTIDWQRLALTRDDHTVLFWKALKERASKENLLLFFNGSGNPYADLNYMESPHEMASDRWRDWVGVAWGIGMMNRLKPGNRAVPLYWSAKTDYVNRFLALGWIPAPMVYSATIPPMRAEYETGNLLPMRIRHSPDWMQDFSIEVESHTMERPSSNERLVSYISRAANPQDIPVTIDLGSLGYAPDTRINVWRLTPRYDTASKRNYCLADRELKENWRTYGWDDGNAMMVPELAYSGPAVGEFKQVLEQLAPNAMVQFLFAPGPASIRTVDGLPKNYFYTAVKNARINGKTATLERPSEILLIDREHSFTDVTTNGTPAKVRPIDIGGVIGTLVSLPAGTHHLQWVEKSAVPPQNGGPDQPIIANGLLSAGPDGTLLAIDHHGRTICTGTSPIKLPPQRENGAYKLRFAGSSEARDFTLGGGKGSNVPMYSFYFHPETTTQEEVSVKHGDVTVTRKAEWIGRFEDVVGLQRNLLPSVAEANPEQLTLLAGTTRRDGGANLAQRAFAGLELNGARQIRLRFQHTFLEPQSIALRHVRKGAPHPETNFTGFVLDFRVNGKYAKRVAISTGLYHTQYANPDPPHWGSGGKPDAVLELGEFIDGPAERVFSLDLEPLAPKDWDGTLFFSIGTARILPNRRLAVSILGFNDKEASDFLMPEQPIAAGARTMPNALRSKRLTQKPASLTGTLNAAEWQKWSPFERLQPLGTDPAALIRSATRAWLAHDYEYIYLAVEAAEPGRAPECKDAAPWRNERIELHIVRPDKKLYQVLADASGKTALFLGGIEAAPEGIICKATTVPGKGWMLFLAVPVNDLGFDMQRTPVVVKANLCRARLKPETEYSTWSPCQKGFSETESFSSFIFDFE